MKEGIKEYILFFKKIFSIGEKSKENYAGYLKVKYRKFYKKLRKEIFTCCDMYQGDLFLSTFFYYDQDKFNIPKRDLVFLASNILNNLSEEDILNVIKPPLCEETHYCRDSPYAFYKVKPHENLVKQDSFIKKKMKILN